MGRKRKSQDPDDKPLNFNDYDDEDGDDIDDDMSIDLSLDDDVSVLAFDKSKSDELKEKHLRNILSKESDDWHDPEDDVMYGFDD